ncbi:hypothetical protein GCM10023165_47730 [Variovorax defluvii]|uniref:Uncharacterized protein n=1 Tax=Variovorax defluvii TaxID=913761 RepID=A0ABP8IC56_9BURK
MPSGFDPAATGSQRPPGANRRMGGRPVMSEKEIEAYLVARDAVRRIQRATPLLASVQRGGLVRR